MRFSKALPIWLLIFAQLAWIPGCRDDFNHSNAAASAALASGASGSTASGFNLGEAVFVVVRAYLPHTGPDGQKRVAIWNSHRSDIVDSVNRIVPNPLSPSTLGAVFDILPLVDDGTIPGMTDDLAAILDKLVNEPNQATIGALHTLATQKTPVTLADFVAMGGRTLALQSTEDLITAAVTLIRKYDGVDDKGQPNGERNLARDLQLMLGRTLQSVQLPASGRLLEKPFVDGLLEEGAIRAGTPLGAPAWTVRADTNGNPKPALVPSTGTLVPPFVDGDGDGVADTDAQGWPIDASGARIDIPPFGDPNDPTWPRDVEGRALTRTSGALLYDYVDAKKTLLGLVGLLLGKGLDRGVPAHAMPVIEDALGQTRMHDAGTPGDPSDDYPVFQTDSPPANLAWGLFELLKTKEARRTVRAVVHLIQTDPARAESLVLSVGRAVEDLRRVSLGPTSPRQLLDQLLPVLDDIFESGNGTSTARLLMDLVNQLGPRIQTLPEELALLVQFREAVREQAPDNDPDHIDETRSVPVDYSQTRWVTGPSGQTIDNRSLLEQAIDLLVKADGCSYFGKSLAEWTLDLMAGLKPSTVGGLIGLLNNAAPIANLACPGIGQDLQSLDALAASGALDALLPLAKVFKDKGEIPLLIDLFAVLQSNGQAVRDLLPATRKVLESQAAPEILDLVGEMTQLSIPSGGVMADPVAAATADLVDDDASVTGPQGQQVSSRAHLLLDPLFEVGDRISAAGHRSDLTALLDDLVALIAERQTNDAGTPNDPSDDFEELAHPGIIPVTELLLGQLDRALGTTQSDWNQRLGDWQTRIPDLIGSRKLPLLVEIGTTVIASPEWQPIRTSLIDLLQPQATRSRDAFGAGLKVITLMIQQPVAAAPVETVAHFLGGLLIPGQGQGMALRFLNGLHRILHQNNGRTVLAMARNALDRGPNGTDPAPAEVLFEVFADLAQAGQTGPTTRQTWADTIEGVRDFLTDQSLGLGRLYQMIKNRR